MLELAHQYDLYLQQFNVLPLPHPWPILIGQIITIIAVVMLIYGLRSVIMFFNGTSEVIATLKVTNEYLRSIRTDADLTERHLVKTTAYLHNIADDTPEILDSVIDIKNAWE